MPPASRADRLGRGLHHLRLGVDQREDALGRGQAVLELAPERGDVGQRPPEEPDRLHEQVPVAGVIAVGSARGQPADVDQQRDTQTPDDAPRIGKMVLSVSPRRSPTP